jgi:uncharacterized protein YcaQ
MARHDSIPAISLKSSEARAIALAAQGFGARRTAGRSAWPRMAETIARMGFLQLDSVNVLVRAHYLPLFSRLGDYDRDALDRHAFGPKRRHLFEYWAHEASLVPVRFHPLMRWRMARATRHIGIYRGLARFAREQGAYVKAVLGEVAARGPIAASELNDPGKRGGPWWGWNKGKIALEYLFWTGEVTAAGRRSFERVYDLTERTLPAEILALPTPNEADAIRALTAFAGGALGVATEIDIREYFRLPIEETRRAIRELVEAGKLVTAEVDGWDKPAFLAVDAARPSRVPATALVSPFDPLVWHRPRTERLFDFHYRIELYTPAAKRRFGYYVLPFLHNGRLVGRVDLKSDRGARTLLVHGAYSERPEKGEALAEPLAEELRRLACWLALDEIRVGARGDLAKYLVRLS